MIQDSLLEWRFSAILLLEVMIAMTDNIDREHDLIQARELMVRLVHDDLDDAAKMNLFVEACSVAERLVFGHRIGSRARADLQAYAEQMRQDGALDWLMDSLYYIGSDDGLMVHLQVYTDRAFAAILRGQYIKAESAVA